MRRRAAHALRRALLAPPRPPPPAAAPLLRPPLPRCAAAAAPHRTLITATPASITPPLGARALHLARAVREEAVVGDVTFSLETGRLARLADAAVVCSAGASSVLVTLVCETAVVADRDFMPLQVDYRERTAAVGRIPSTFTRREGAPKDREILVARVVDRALRPLFPPGFFFETQLVATVLSADGDTDPDVLAINAASAALACSDVPWAGPVGAVRLARINGRTVLNPRPEEAENAELIILYAGTEERTLMVEASAKGAGVSEAEFAAALREAHAAAAALVPAQRKLAQRLGRGATKRAPPPPVASPELMDAVRAAGSAPLNAVYARGSALNKATRASAMDAVKRSLLAPGALPASLPPPTPLALDAAFDALSGELLRALALEAHTRIDGRGLGDLREIVADASVLRHVHGSALFERGDTQALATVTVGGLDDAQRLDSLVGPSSKRLMLHYGFPPFSVNETGKVGSLSRREIGHGALAEKALAGSLPDAATFPFCVRVNSETLGSNGSSSMAAVCAGSMALMDAGVPLPRHVAGISIGLILDEDASTGDVKRHVLLTDIQGIEDHLGDMDWKIAGTSEGITAVQLDVKPAGVPLDILIEALTPARDARMKLLSKLTAAIDGTSSAQRDNAPRAGSLEVERDQLGRLIGPGGSTVRDLEKRSGAKLTVQDTGVVAIFAPDKASYATAVHMIEALVGGGAKVGASVRGRVVSIRDFGAFLELPSGEQGLLHISEVSHARTERIEHAVSMDAEMEVMVIGKDPRGNLKLSLKALIEPPASAGSRERVAFDRRRVERT
jgi:polyribonucleotide nucleotidyltransferase